MESRLPAKSFKDLLVWQKVHKFVLGAFKYTSSFPREEIYALTSQYRRASVSIVANIAEGFKKRGKADKAMYMNIAQGSFEECRYYLILSRDLNYWPNNELTVLINYLVKCWKHIPQQF